MHIQHIEFDLHASQAHFQSAEQFKSYFFRFWQFKLLTQSGDLCRHSVQSSDVVGQGGTNKSDLDNVYDVDLTSADATAAAVVKSKSPHTITSGLLSHSETNHD